MALNSNFRTLTADNIEGLVDDRNYLKSSFENGTLTGWTEMTVALSGGLPSGVPTIGSTAASSLALSATTTTPLSGSRSLLMNVPTSLTAGHGFISDEFTLDRMDLGKVLTVSFDYERTSGTLNFSGLLGSQTLMVYIYDASLSPASAANWIQPAGYLGMNQSSGPGRVSCTFQSSVVAGQKYRVAVIASQAVGSACSLEFDNFTCSRVTAPIGPVVTDWVSYTPTGLWTTNATYTGKWRRVGDSMEVQARILLTGAPNNTNVTINIPSQFTIDLSKVSSSEFLTTVFGAGHAYDVSTLAHFNLQAGLVATGVFLTYQNQLTGQIIGLTPSSPFVFAAGDWIDVTFQVPIQGWSSSTQLSSDSDTRVVAAAYLRSTAQSIPAATDTTVIYDTRRIDTHAAMNTSNGRFYAPVSGVYRISASVFYNFFVPAAGNPLQMRFLKRNAAGTIVEDAYKDNVVANAAVGQEFALRTSSLFSCNAGETLEVVLWQNTGAARTTIGNINFVEIERLSGPSVVAASEVVEATYGSTAGNVMNNGAEMWLDFPTKVRDTHNAVSGTGTGNKTVSNTGWKFTAPITGRYYVNAVWHIQSANVANSVAYGYIAVNGAGQSHSDIKAGQNPVGDAFGVQINGELFLNAGDYIEIVGYQANGANRNQQANSLRNRVEIVRVGAY